MTPRRLSKLLPLVLAAPFLMGTSSAQKAGQMSECFFPSLYPNHKTYSITNTYNYHYAVSYSSITVELIASIGPSEPTITRVGYTAMVDTRAGQSITWTTKIDYSKFSTKTTPNANQLLYTVTNTGYATEQYYVFLNTSKPESFTINSESGSVSKSRTTTWTERFESGWNKAVRYEWEGFTQTITDPEYGVVPLRNMKIRQYNQNGEPTFLSFKQATLTISDATNFKMGEETSVNGIKKKVVKLRGYREEGSKYVSFKTQDIITYSHDFREVREDGVMKEGDITSNHIFLPPVANGEVRQTTFELNINWAGHEVSDYFYSKFTVIQTHNYIGTAPDSENLVEEY